MSQQETVSSIIQKIRDDQAVGEKTQEALAIRNQEVKKQKELLELQGFLSPIFEKTKERYYSLKETGIIDLIYELAGIYGKEKEWKQEHLMARIPLDTLRNWVLKNPNILAVNPWLKNLLREDVSAHCDYTRGENVSNIERFTRGAEDKLRSKYPNKLIIARSDPGSSIEIKAIFSKIAVSPEPDELSLAALETDMDGNGEGLKADDCIDFETRRRLYKRAARKLKNLGICIEVGKRVVDEREVEGIDRSKFHYDLNPSLYEITRRVDFVVFENTSQLITIEPYGSSEKKTFDLRKKTAINQMRNFLGEVIAIGGDISGISHAEAMQTIRPKSGPGWAGK